MRVEQALGAKVTTGEPRECNIARTLDLLGERWTLLAMREVLLGVTTFDQIVKNTGAPRNILATRLTKLVDSQAGSRRNGLSASGLSQVPSPRP